MEILVSIYACCTPDTQESACMVEARLPLIVLRRVRRPILVLHSLIVAVSELYMIVYYMTL